MEPFITVPTELSKVGVLAWDLPLLVRGLNRRI